MNITELTDDKRIDNGAKNLVKVDREFQMRPPTPTLVAMNLISNQVAGSINHGERAPSAPLNMPEEPNVLKVYQETVNKMRFMSSAILPGQHAHSVSLHEFIESEMKHVKLQMRNNVFGSVNVFKRRIVLMLDYAQNVYGLNADLRCSYFPLY